MTDYDAVGQSVIDLIIDTDMLRSSCAFSDDHGIVHTWMRNSAEQIGECVRHAVDDQKDANK